MCFRCSWSSWSRSRWPPRCLPRCCRWYGWRECSPPASSRCSPMSADKISRRAFAGGLAALALARRAHAQGYAGLGETADGFAKVEPGKTFSFPADHGPHPEFRIEWWYLTANLVDAAGNAYGAQWTLFRQALQPGTNLEGWATQQVWMAHAAVTRADTHRTTEILARGGVGQAGVEAVPFRAWIDAWQMRAL